MRGAGDLRRRLLRHHLPLALASAGVLLAFMTVPRFDANRYAHADLTSASFPKQRANSGRMTNMTRRSGDHIGGQTGTHAGGGNSQHSGAHGGQRGSGQTRRHGASQPQHNGMSRSGGSFLGLSARGFTVASGYLALALLALTLLIGPLNLLRRRRNPVSSYLRRDVGAWTAAFSVMHVICGLRVHGSGRILNNAFFDYFVAGGRPLTNSFGLGNWTGLAATVIVVGLLALSSDAALRTLKARNWKRLQRLNYALFLLVVAHAFFYGALLRTDSPYTFLLLLSVIVVFSGQAVGFWVYRHRHGRKAERSAVLVR